MPALQLGKIEILSPRELWKHEERDFTPWLAQNIEQLSAVLGVPIVIDQTEHRVGAYELDLLGRVEENDAVVIIENQLHATDHGHLGQLLTYAAGLDAAIVIWVAGEIRDEHRAVIEWLNAHTHEKVSFFLVRPEVIRIDASLPAVRFHLEVAPSEFSRRLKSVVEKEDRPSFEFRRKFWEAMLQYLVANGHTWAKGRATSKDSWISSPVGRSGVSANISMAQGSRMRVEIYLSNDSEKLLFERLYAHKAEIETRLLGEAVSWERLDDATASRVAVYMPYDKQQVTEETPQRKELFSWVAKNLTILRAVARELLVEKANA